MIKILVLGSNGMVGSSILNSFSEDSKFKIIPSTRKDTNLFKLDETEKLINDTNPDILINAAAKVGGIVANNEQRTQFLIENLRNKYKYFRIMYTS